VGNALGSCIANICLILGLAAVIRKVPLRGSILKRELPFLIFVIPVVFVLGLNGVISKAQGAFLFMLEIAFVVYIVKREGEIRKKDVVEEKQIYRVLKKDYLKFIFGIAGVVVAARFAIIPGAVGIANRFGVPETVIALSVVAIGTSLPELVTAITASLKNMGDLAAGNVIGANLMNLLCVVGLSALLNPLKIDGQIIAVTLPLVFLISALLFVFSKTGESLSRREGSIFLGIYILYTFYMFMFAYA
jgi:cation:H+ antiporter